MLESPEFHRDEVEKWTLRSRYDGRRLWKVLHQVLLGPHGGTLDSWSHEPTLDGSILGDHLRRETEPVRIDNLQAGGSRLLSNRNSSDHLAQSLLGPARRRMVYGLGLDDPPRIL